MVACDENEFAFTTGTQPLVNNLYQGMTLDAVTGLYYERYRDDSPTLGRSNNYRRSIRWVSSVLSADIQI